MNKKLFLASMILTVVMLGALFFVTRKGTEKKAEEVVPRPVPVTQSDFDYITVGNSRVWTATDEDIQPGIVKLSNELYDIEFDKKGATVKSVVLRAYEDGDNPLDLINHQELDDASFMLYAGRDFSIPLDDLFEVTSRTDDSVTFTRNYRCGDGEYSVKKTYRLSNQYMICLDVDIVSADGRMTNGVDKFVYTVEFAPQLGPQFVQSKRSRQNERTFYLKTGDKKNKQNVKFSGHIFTYDDPYEWFELTGKYFSLVMFPQDTSDFSVGALSDNKQSRMFLSRLNKTQSEIHDRIYAYMGPQLKDSLKVFDYAEDNDFGLKDRNLVRAMDGGGALSWLQNILKWIMMMFYRLVPNWGMSIIFLTIVIKILLYPLNARSARSSAAMQRVAPEMEALKNQYKDDPVKLNQATMALYKKNGISPLSSMVPLLIQLPLLFAVYGLLNKHFELRGAMFIPGWIEDLSAPECVATLPFSIPLLGPEIHLLPILYCISMIFSMLYTQRSSTASVGSGGMQKFMTYGLPAILFFSLYNVASGLLVYWSVMNVFSIMQQIYETKKRNRKEAEEKKVSADNEKKTNTFGVVKLPPKAKKKK